MAKKIQIDELENMEKEQAKAVEQCFNPAREKYIRQVDGPKVYPMGRHPLISWLDSPELS